MRTEAGRRIVAANKSTRAFARLPTKRMDCHGDRRRQAHPEAALDLPDADRAKLAAIETETVADGSLDPDIEAARVPSAKRRLDDNRSGKSETIASEVVERKLEELVGRP